MEVFAYCVLRMCTNSAFTVPCEFAVPPGTLEVFVYCVLRALRIRPVKFGGVLRITGCVLYVAYCAADRSFWRCLRIVHCALCITYYELRIVYFGGACPFCVVHYVLHIVRFLAVFAYCLMCIAHLHSVCVLHIAHRVLCVVNFGGSCVLRVAHGAFRDAYAGCD